MKYLPRKAIWLDTSSGSRYRIDPVAGVWERQSHDSHSNLLRTDGGPLWGLERKPRVGECAVIYGPSLTEGGLFRMLETTPVVRIWEREPDEPHAHLPGWWDLD